MFGAKGVIQHLFRPIYINVQLDLTNSCNLRCKHCYHPHHINEGNLLTQDWLNAIDRISEMLRATKTLPHFYLCGGEPTLAQSFPSVLSKLRLEYPKASITVLTNGTQLNRPLPENFTPLSLIADHQVSAQVSLDGATESNHDFIRGRGSFVKALQGIQSLRKQNVPVILQSVLSRTTVSQLESFFDLAQSLDAYEMNFIRLIEVGHAVSYTHSFSETEHLMGDELKSAMENILFHSRRTGIATSTRGPLWHLIDPTLGSASRLGFYEIIVDYQGYLKISSRTPVRLGHVLKDDIFRVLRNSKVLQSLRAGQIEGCSSCSHFRAKKCSGDRNFSYAMTGSYLGPDYGCWEWRKVHAPQLQKLSKQSSSNVSHTARPLRNLQESKNA